MFVRLDELEERGRGQVVPGIKVLKYLQDDFQSRRMSHVHSVRWITKAFPPTSDCRSKPVAQI